MLGRFWLRSNPSQVDSVSGDRRTSVLVPMRHALVKRPTGLNNRRGKRMPRCYSWVGASSVAGASSCASETSSGPACCATT